MPELSLRIPRYFKPRSYLQIGDRLTEVTGEWEVTSRPYLSAAGKLTNVQVRKVGQPDVTEIRTWGTHERVSVRRA